MDANFMGYIQTFMFLLNIILLIYNLTFVRIPENRANFDRVSLTIIQIVELLL